jgi:hypothetical protein
MTKKSRLRLWLSVNSNHPFYTLHPVGTEENFIIAKPKPRIFRRWIFFYSIEYSGFFPVLFPYPQIADS